MDPRYEVLRRLDDSQNLFLGVCAGAIEAALTQPLTYVKNMLQQQRPLSLDPRVIYRGTPASCLADGSIIGVQFITCGALQKLFELNLLAEMGSALVAGIVSGVPCCLLELTMIQQQHSGRTFFRTFNDVLRLAPLRGLGPSAGREAFFAVGYLGLSPQLERLASAAGLNGTPATASSALASGVICAAFTHPLDTIKSCMQGDLTQRYYKGPIATFRTIAKDGGIAPFYRGYTARAFMVGLCFYIFTEAKLQVAHLCFPDRLR